MTKYDDDKVVSCNISIGSSKEDNVYLRIRLKPTKNYEIVARLN